MSYWIMADIGCDLPKSYADRYERLQILPMPYRMEGEDRLYSLGDELRSPEFYAKLAAGHQATTSQIPVATYYEAIKAVVEKGGEVLVLTLSSGISGTHQSAQMARSMLLETYPNAKVLVVDSLCASLGFGLLLHHVLQNRAQGMSLQENARWAMDNCQRVNHWFTVDDLNFLFRGGRVTRSTALLGGMLRIKPVMRVNYEGKLAPHEKVQGRKHSLKNLADKAIALSNPQAGQACFISHGNCEEEARYVAGLIKKGLPKVSEVLISPCGAIIGAHSGPGTMAVFFLADKR